MRAKHTPGPWDISDVRPLLMRRDDAEHDRYYAFKDSEKEANARLISAAPDLLAALKALIDAAPLKYSGRRVQDAMAQAREVIFKAEEGPL